MPIDIKTTILHYTPLVERKANMLSQMEKFGFSRYSFYQEYDGNILTDETIAKYCTRKHLDPLTVEKKISPWNLKFNSQKELNIAEISLTIKFGKVFEELSNVNEEYFLIFEDDVFLCENFDGLFYEYLSKTPTDWEVIYFGSGANLKPEEIQADKVAYRKNHPASRCADSILLKKKAIDDLANTWFPFHLISDWELGYQHYLHDHVVYWWEPSLVRQGSEYGIFKSTLR